MNLFLIPSLLLFLTGLSNETASLVNSVNELVCLIEEDSCLGSRMNHSKRLIEYYMNARIPAPPVFTEQFDLMN